MALMYPEYESLVRLIGHSISKLCIRITQQCNLRCSFCLAKISNSSKNILSQEQLFRITKYFAEHGLCSLSISGGEPFLYKGLHQYLIYLNKLQIPRSITTNGSIEIREFIQLLCDTGTRLKVSVYGISDIHNSIQREVSYEQVMGVLTQALYAGVPVTVNSMLCRINCNVSSLNIFLHELVNAGVKRVRFIRYALRNPHTDHGLYHIPQNLFLEFHDWMREAAIKWQHQIDIRYSDYFIRPYIVLEPSGELVLEHGTSANDQVLHRFLENE